MYFNSLEKTEADDDAALAKLIEDQMDHLVRYRLDNSDYNAYQLLPFDMRMNVHNTIQELSQIEEDYSNLDPNTAEEESDFYNEAIEELKQRLDKEFGMRIRDKSEIITMLESAEYEDFRTAIEKNFTNWIINKYATPKSYQTYLSLETWQKQEVYNLVKEIVELDRELMVIDANGTSKKQKIKGLKSFLGEKVEFLKIKFDISLI